MKQGKCYRELMHCQTCGRDSEDNVLYIGDPTVYESDTYLLLSAFSLHSVSEKNYLVNTNQLPE